MYVWGIHLKFQNKYFNSILYDSSTILHELVHVAQVMFGIVINEEDAVVYTNTYRKNMNLPLRNGYNDPAIDKMSDAYKKSLRK